MQILYFEPAWERTIATEDRQNIIEKFDQTKLKVENGIHFTFLWAAENHKKELLITVLIHNVRSYPLQLNDTVIAYTNNDGTQYINTFYLKEIIPTHHSMPWTFMFPKSGLISESPDYVIY